MYLSEPFLDEHQSFITFFKAENMHRIIRQIKEMLKSDIPYHVYASVEDVTELTILSRVIGLQNEQLITKEIRMTVTPKKNGYLVDIYLMQCNEW